MSVGEATYYILPCQRCVEIGKMNLKKERYLLHDYFSVLRCVDLSY